MTFVSAEAKLHLKTLVSQLVLLFSKLQASIVIKGLPATGLFPCNPPLTPEVYANGNIMARCRFALVLSLRSSFALARKARSKNEIKAPGASGFARAKHGRRYSDEENIGDRDR